MMDSDLAETIRVGFQINVIFQDRQRSSAGDRQMLYRSHSVPRPGDHIYLADERYEVERIVHGAFPGYEGGDPGLIANVIAKYVGPRESGPQLWSIIAPSPGGGD